MPLTKEPHSRFACSSRGNEAQICFPNESLLPRLLRSATN
jgi:hypothetical protein